MGRAASRTWIYKYQVYVPNSLEQLMLKTRLVIVAMLCHHGL